MCVCMYVCVCMHITHVKSSLLEKVLHCKSVLQIVPSFDAEMRTQAGQDHTEQNKVTHSWKTTIISHLLHRLLAHPYDLF